ncbi:hypothetical protein [Salinispora pacifica]|uniref:hypothetical protein n=1 Tax=Salinispora pacifica TaxID=351187 RepID=UPI00037F7BC1|nr:hypothetical protein [Salinispora pacifica]
MLTYREGDDARRGGLDLVISLTADQADALGTDAAELAEAIDTLLVGLAALRTGRDPAVPAGTGQSLKDQPVTAETRWDEWLLRDLATLRHRVAGATAAAIRSHANHGGSYGDLAAATSVPRGTAQRRRDAVTRTAPGDAERRATTRPDTEGAPVMGKRNIASGNDRVAIQAGQIKGGKSESGDSRRSGESTNIRSGNARVGRQHDRIDGDLNI